MDLALKKLVVIIKGMYPTNDKVAVRITLGGLVEQTTNYQEAEDKKRVVIQLKDQLMGAIDIVGVGGDQTSLRVIADRLSSIMKKRELTQQLQSSNQELQKLVDRLQKALIDVESSEGAIKALVAAMEKKHPYTEGHSRRVTDISVAIARKLGMSEEDIEILEISGLLHDIGKIGIPESILDKAGQLTDEEFKIIMTHPDNGVDILKSLATNPKMKRVIEVMRQHHEKWDGTGYPQRLKGEEIDPLARIMSLADAFDAMTSSRSYRKGMPLHTALERLIIASGTQFEPQLVETLFKDYVQDISGRDDVLPQHKRIAQILSDKFSKPQTKYRTFEKWVTALRSMRLIKSTEKHELKLSEPVDLSSFVSRFPDRYAYDISTGTLTVTGEMLARERKEIAKLLTSGSDKGNLVGLMNRSQVALFDDAAIMKILELTKESR